jgi:hypothetical protein
MYVSSFRDLQKIYEGGYRGMSYNPSPNKTYTAEPSNHSYRGSLPFNAGGSDNEFARMAANTGVVIADDEEHTATGVISRVEVIDKIQELMKTANQDEMMYAVHLLGQLKEFIKSN